MICALRTTRKHVCTLPLEGSCVLGAARVRWIRLPSVRSASRGSVCPRTLVIAGGKLNADNELCSVTCGLRLLFSLRLGKTSRVATPFLHFRLRPSIFPFSTSCLLSLLLLLLLPLDPSHGCSNAKIDAPLLLLLLLPLRLTTRNAATTFTRTATATEGGLALSLHVRLLDAGRLCLHDSGVPVEQAPVPRMSGSRGREGDEAGQSGFSRDSLR